jgi:hypothetical protein
MLELILKYLQNVSLSLHKEPKILRNSHKFLWLALTLCAQNISFSH